MFYLAYIKIHEKRNFPIFYSIKEINMNFCRFIFSVLKKNKLKIKGILNQKMYISVTPQYPRLLRDIIFFSFICLRKHLFASIISCDSASYDEKKEMLSHKKKSFLSTATIQRSIAVNGRRLTRHCTSQIFPRPVSRNLYYT